MVIKRKTRYWVIGIIIILVAAIITIAINRRNSAPETPKTTPEREYIEEKKREATKKLEDAKNSDTSRIDDIDDALDILGSD